MQLCWSGLTQYDASETHRQLTVTGHRQCQQQGQEMPADDRMICDGTLNWGASQSQSQSDLFDGDDHKVEQFPSSASIRHQGKHTMKPAVNDLKDFGNEVEVNSLLPP